MITRITLDTLANQSIVSLQTVGIPPQVQVKQQHNPPRLTLDIKPAHLSPMQEKTMIVHEPESVVSHLEAIPRADAQDAVVQVVVYLRTATSFDVHQDTDGIRLALQPSSPAPVAARASGPVRSPTVATPPPVPLAPPPVAPAAPILATAVPRLAQISPIVRRGYPRP